MKLEFGASLLLAAFSIFPVVCLPAYGQSDADLVKAAQNPLASMANIPF
jgi:hypothetical protein